MKYRKKGFARLSREEYEFLLEKRAAAKKNGDFKLDRRIRGVILVGYKGVKQCEAARRCETHPRNFSKWLALYREGGYEELANFKYKGKPHSLSPEQLKKLDAIVEGDPAEYNYDAGLWTASMVMEVIYREFGVRYSVSMVQKILRKLGFSFKMGKKNSRRQARQNKKSGWTKNCRKSSKR